MPTLGQTIFQLRKRRGWSQQELADQAGIQRSYVGHIERGHTKSPSPDVIQALARALEVSPESLFTAQVSGAGPPRKSVTPYEMARDLEAALREVPILVPVTTQRASAGYGAQAEAEAWPYYPRPGERGHRFIAVPLYGDCMEPEIPEGYTVLADEDASPRPGDIVVAEHEGETIVKELQQRNGDLYLVAKQGRPPVKVNASTRIVGVVVQWGKRAKQRP